MQTKMKGINEFFLSRMDGMNEVKFNAELRLFHLDIDCHGTIIAFSPFYLFAQY